MSASEKIAQTLHHLERAVLPHIGKSTKFSDLVEKTKLQEVEVMRALQWLGNKKLVQTTEDLKTVVRLDDNGKDYKKIGLPEWRFLKHTTKQGRSVDEIAQKGVLAKDELSICLGHLRKLQAIEMRKEGKKLICSLTVQGEKLRTTGMTEQELLKRSFPVPLDNLSKDEKAALERLLQRKRIVKTDLQKNIFATITEAGKEVQKSDLTSAIADRLTSQDLKEGTWKDKTYRRYDVAINVPPTYGGKRHPVEQSIRYIKDVWLDLGFTELKGEMIQTAFWDLDCLFVPQDHPARDMQDTFYLKNPSTGTLPKELVKKVQAAHETGGDTGSTGWKYKWSVDEAKKLMMITHDTYLSARMLASIKKEDLPIKTFQILKVFRNEALSWKHLFEFYQVGGIVVDPDANLKNLKGYLKTFFEKMGFPDVRIRPAHFPYTEPSAEVDVWHPKKKQWVEVAGSGLFRPEMVKPLLGIDCPVLAWGIGLERSLMEYYDLKDVRDVYKNDLKQLRESKLWMK